MLGVKPMDISDIVVQLSPVTTLSNQR